MVDAAGVERRRAPLQAMHLIAAAEQEFGEIGAVLAGGAGDQGDLARHRPGGASDVEGLAAAAAAFLVRIAEDEARLKLVLHIVHLRADDEHGGSRVDEEGYALLLDLVLEALLFLGVFDRIAHAGAALDRKSKLLTSSQ